MDKNLLSEDILNIMRDKTVLCCVSGGVDSVVLLHLLWSAKKDYGIKLFACHFEHGIRGEESLMDMKFVENLCHELGIKCFSKRENVLEHKGNVESNARKLRYEFFYEILGKINGDYLALAHHCNDNAETVLMHMIRGCDLHGLMGISQSRGEILRPLLTVSKDEIETFAKEISLEYRVDKTNFDTAYFRNYIRQDVLPLLTKKNPNFIKNVKRLSDSVSLEESYFNQLIENSGMYLKKAYGYDIILSEFNKPHLAIKKRCVYYLLRKLIGQDFDHESYDRIVSLTKKETGKKVNISKDYFGFKSQGRISLVKNQEKINGEYSLCLGENKTPFGKFLLKEIDASKIDKDKLGELKLAYFNIDTKLFVRGRIKGDKVSEHKKLKDVFIDAKIDVFLRDNYPLICSNNGILFIPNVFRGKKERANMNKVLTLEYICDFN